MNVGINAYMQTKAIGESPVDLSIRVMKSVLFYIDNAIQLHEQDGENFYHTYQLLNNANELLIGIVETLRPEIDDEQAEIVLTILKKTIQNVIMALRDDYEPLKDSVVGIKTILHILQKN